MLDNNQIRQNYYQIRQAKNYDSSAIDLHGALWCSVMLSFEWLGLSSNENTSTGPYSSYPI